MVDAHFFFLLALSFLSFLTLNVIWTLATCSRHHDGARASLWKRRMSMFCMLRKEQERRDGG